MVCGSRWTSGPGIGMSSAATGLHGELFADAEMIWALGDEALLVGMLNFESELAHALEAVRLAPPGTAMAVSAQCDPRLYDIAELGRAATLAGNPLPSRRNGSISARPART